MSIDFDSFYEQFLLKGMEHFRLFYSIYRGFVARNDDPEKRGRIQVRCPVVGHNIAPDVWVDPIMEGAGRNRGAFFVPEVGDSVRVMFERGRPEKPVAYMGGWYGIEDLPTEFAYTENVRTGSTTGPVPEKRGIVTRKGHKLVFSDVAGAETVELAWHKPAPTDAAVSADSNGDRTQSADRATGNHAYVKFTPDGDVQIVNQNGSKVYLDAANQQILIEDQNGAKVLLNSTGATVEAAKIVLKSSVVELADQADQQAIRGNDLMTWLSTHTHGTGMGPSSPPIQPPPATILSGSVKLR